jgi:cellulose synthase (UDP-forming)
MTEPSLLQRLIMRLMILTGVGSMLYLFVELLRPEHVGNKVLYAALLSTLGYFCLKILHEWYHYLAISAPKKPLDAPEYRVDVLTTFCAGEPYAMIRNTLEAVQNIRYPHTTYLCDEANDPYCRQLCEELGVVHVTRDNRMDAKAGNINNALKQAKGEICLILDPDHIPVPEFLDEIVPYFVDPKVGYVQTVQSYYNANESLIAKGAAQQTYQFYGPMMMTMHHYGTVQAIGANCTFRRSALDSIGGHAPGLAEDMHTAMLLQAKGWKSVYVPKILSRGLVPSTLSAYYKQQLKWSRGVFELLWMVYPRIFRQLSWRQRLHFGTLPAFYLAGLFYLLNFLIPMASLFSGSMPLRMDLGEFLLLGAPLFYATILIRHYSQNWLMEERERGFHIMGGMLLIVAWWIHTMGFVMSILRMKVPYDPTPKDGNEANNWPLNIPNLVVLFVSLAALLYGISTYREPHFRVMEIMAALNMGFMALTIAASRQQSWRRRVESRRETLLADYWLRRLRVAVWHTNHRLFGLFRLAAPFVLILIAAGAFSLLSNKESHKFTLLTQPELADVLAERTLNDSNLNQVPAMVERGPVAYAGLRAALLPEFRILKPAVLLYPGHRHTYQAAMRQDESWLASPPAKGWKLEWYLLRTDPKLKDYRMRYLGSGHKVLVEVPRRYEQYRVVLKTSYQGHTRYYLDRLNTPLPGMATGPLAETP